MAIRISILFHERRVTRTVHREFAHQANTGFLARIPLRARWRGRKTRASPASHGRPKGMTVPAIGAGRAATLAHSRQPAAWSLQPLQATGVSRSGEPSRNTFRTSAGPLLIKVGKVTLRVRAVAHGRDKREATRMHRRPPRLLGRALVVCVPVLGLALAFGPAAGASTAGASPSARAAAAARTALEHLTVGWHSAFRRVSGSASGVRGLSQVQSTNWSGYADTGSGFSTVTGSWTEPTATCSGADDVARGLLGRHRRLQQQLGGAGRHARRVLPRNRLLLHLVGDVPHQRHPGGRHAACGRAMPSAPRWCAAAPATR